MKKSPNHLKSKVDLIVSENFETINNVVDAVARKHFHESIGFDSIEKFKTELLNNVDISIESIVFFLDTLSEKDRTIAIKNLDNVLETTVGGFLEKYIEMNFDDANGLGLFDDKPIENEETFKIAGLELTHVFSKQKIKVILHAKQNAVKMFIKKTGLCLHQSPFLDDEYEVEFDIEGQS